MQATPDSLHITDINTELGNRILTHLVDAGWRVEYEYPESTIDKGIDFDAYTLVREGQKLDFEWDNWDEWQICGSPSAILGICSAFSIQPPSSNR